MESLIKFINEYEKLKEEIPNIYMNVKQIRNGSRWRIEVFKADTINGDSVLLHAEDDDQEKAFQKALNRIKDIPLNLAEPKGYTINGQKVLRRA